MTSTMRERFKSKKYQVILWIAMFSLLGASALPELLNRLFGPGDWILKVDSSYVSQQQFNNKVEEEKQQLEMFRKQFGPYADALLASSGMNLDPKELAINSLTHELLLTKVAKQLNLQVDPEFIQHEILKKIPKEVIEAYGTTDLNVLSQLFGFNSAAEFTKIMENSLKNQLALDLASGATYVPEFELKNNFNASFAKKKYSILIFPNEKYLNEVKKTAISKDELKRFFDEQNKNERKYWVPEKRAGSRWEFSPATYGIKVNDKDIEAYYNKNKRTEFLELPAQVKVRRILFAMKDKSELSKIMPNAQKIRNEIMADKTKFADYAKKYSEDKDTAANGGLIYFFSKGQKDPAFEKAAFALKTPNDISDIIETKYGLEILQLVEKKPITFKKLADVKSKIVAKAEKDKFDKSFNTDMRQFSSGTKTKEFLEFAKLKGAKETKIAPTVSNNSLITQKLFGIKNENGISSFSENDKGIAIQLTKIEKSYIPTLESIQKTVENDLYKKKALNKITSDVQKANEERATKTFEQLKEKYGVTLKDTGWIDFNQKNEIAKLQKESIPTDKLLTMEKEDAVITDFSNNNGYLIKLEHIEPFSVTNFESKKSLLEQELSKKRKQELEAGFIASLKKHAKIKINEKAIKQFMPTR